MRPDVIKAWLDVEIKELSRISDSNKLGAISNASTTCRLNEVIKNLENIKEEIK